MLTIRLQRAGKRNRPEFRIVLAEKTAAASKKFIEVLGHYNPRTKDFAVKSEDRLKYWIAQHVELSPTIHNLLITKKLIEGKKTQAFNIPKKPAAKVEETKVAPAKVEQAPVAAAPEEPAIAEPAAEPVPTAPEADVPAETEAPAETNR